MRRLSSVLAFAGVLVAQTSLAQIVLDDPLNGSTSGTQSGGQFVSGGGWQAGQQIKWDLGKVLTEGGLSVQVTNWNPNSDSPQHQFDKQHIINMYESAHGSPHQSDTDVPKAAFWNIRTGATYDNLFKFLSSTAGFDPPPAGRDETRVMKPLGFIDPAQTYTIEVKWDLAGDVTAYLDGQALVTHNHGTPLRLRYVFIGTDNAPAGTYGPQKDVIYKNLVVTGKDTPLPDAGSGGSGGSAGAGGTGSTLLSFEPVADTWSEPAAPTATHGADPELRAGGDGRTIYFRFDVQGVQSVKSAKLFLEAFNAGGGGDIHIVSDNTWLESSLSYQSQPAVDPGILDSLGKVEIGGVYSFDVTSAVKGNGLVSFAITSNDVDGSGYLSKESPNAHPELVIESVAGGGSGGTAGSTPDGGWDDGGSVPPVDGGGGTGAVSKGSTSGGEDSGCGCRTAPRGSSPGTAASLLLALLLLRRRNRRK